MRKNRKKNFIDSQVQGSLLQRIFLHWLCFFGVLAMTMVTMQTLLGDPEISLYERFQQGSKDLMFMTVVMLCLLPAFMLDTIRFSNRFVGPITRLRRLLRQIPEHNYERCKFRGGDFWVELADEYNSVAELVERQQTEIEDLKKVLAKVQTSNSI
ncbi:MAG: hypothetical protein AAF623_18875 [Planctomycetota bacterium]